MKKITPLILAAICSISMLFVACKTQQLVPCEDVRKTTDMPWLTAIVQKGQSWEGQKLLRIDKITYTTDDSNTTHVGFEVRYETMCCDIPGEYIYDCDGEVITCYGGIAGCTGECDIKILTRVTIYSNE